MPEYKSRTALGKNIFIPADTVLTEAPAKIEHYTKHYEVTIGIGPDHTARLIIDEDSVMALRRLEPKITIF